jgi:hypothetical protein
MLSYAFLKPTGVMNVFESALMSDSPDELVKFSAPFEKAFQEIKTWAENQGMGRTLSTFGYQICIEIQMERVPELSEFIQRYEFTSKTTFAIGVGLTPLEAFRAMQESEYQGGDRIVLYSEDIEGTPDIDDRELTKAEGYALDLSFPSLGLEKDDPAMTSAIDTQNMQPSPVAQQDPNQPVQDEPPSQAAPAASPPAEGQPAASQGQPGDGQEAPKKGMTKQKIVETLLMMKQYAPDILRLKEINPKAFEAVKKMVDAIVAIAQGQMKKTEDKVEEESSVPPEESADLNKDQPAPVGHVEDGRMKVMARDEMTRKVTGTHYHRLTHGMIMGNTGHAASPDKPYQE